MRRRDKRKLIAALFVVFALSCAGCGGEKPQDEWLDDISGNIPRTDQSLSGSREPNVLTVCPELQWADPDNENLADMLQTQCGGMMVQLSAGGLMGSGVIYGTEENAMVIVTAAHVLARAEDAVKITFFDDYEVECVDFTISAQSDVAVLRVSMELIPEERLAKYYRVNMDNTSYESLEMGYGCIVMGSRSGVAEDAYEGIILDPWIYMEDYGQHMIWVRAAGKAGMSGGGLFDRQGHYLGILSGVNEDDEWAVVPLGLVQAEL